MDVPSGRRLRDQSVGGEGQKLSDVLLEAMGLPVGLRAAARGGRSTSAGAEITFNDIFRFMYVAQSEINRDIAHSADGYYDPKRRAVFELLFGLTDASLFGLRSRINTLKAEVDVAKAEADAVSRFLEDSGTSDRLSAEIRVEDARLSQDHAKERLGRLRADLTEAMDEQTRILREMLNDAEHSLAASDSLGGELARQEKEYLRERERIERDIRRFERMEAAGRELASLDFLVCPRCMQSLRDRDLPPELCPVCTLPDPIVAASLSPAHDEAAQLRTEIAEIDEQVNLIREDLARTTAATASRRELVENLTHDINTRTRDRVTPRLQAYADAVGAIERAQAEEQYLDSVLQQWDRAEYLATHAESLASERVRLQRDVRAREMALAGRRTEILSEITQEFARTVEDFGIPSVTSARVDEATYLPFLNGQPFDQVSRAGGIVTATQVAYWISLLTVAIRRRDTLYPTFLLIDSPRLALNNQEQLAQQMYRRFVTQVGVNPGLAQFIVADNELPSKYGSEFAEIDFDYGSPTVSTVSHPGPAGVDRLVHDAD
jgi:rubrerythrin